MKYIIFFLLIGLCSAQFYNGKSGTITGTVTLGDTVVTVFGNDTVFVLQGDTVITHADGTITVQGTVNVRDDTLYIIPTDTLIITFGNDSVITIPSDRRMQLYNSVDSAYAQDNYTNAMTTIDYAHHEIHAGSMFKCHYRADKSTGDSVVIQLTTPNTAEWAHLVFEVFTENEGDISFCENPTVALNGTKLSRFNCDRNNADTASVMAFTADSVTAQGTEIFGWHQGTTAVGGRTAGGSNRETNELILKQNEDYRLKVVATVAGWVAVRMFWYEHTNK